MKAGTTPLVDRSQGGAEMVGSRRPESLTPAVERPNQSIGDLLLQALWRSRWLLLAATILGGILGFVVARGIPPSYEASATLLVHESDEEDPQFVSSPQAVRAIAESNTIAARAVSELGLDRAPYGLTSASFRSDHLVVDEIRGSRMLRVRVTLSDPSLAARGANAVAQQTVERARSLDQEETVLLRDHLRSQVDAARARKAELEREMLAYRGGSQLELLQADADAVVEQRGQLLKLMVDIAGEEARVAMAERELTRHEPILRAPRSPAMEGALSRLPTPVQPETRPRQQRPADEERPQRQRARGEGEEERDPAKVPAREERPSRSTRVEQPASDRDSAAEPPIPLEAIGEMANPVYQVLEYQIAAGRTRLAALRRQQQELVEVRKVNAQQLQALTALHRGEIELRRLEAEYDLAEKVYLDVSMKHEQARVKAMSSTPQVQVLDLAAPPRDPVAPRKRRIVAAAAIASLLLAVTVILLAATLRSRRLA